MGPTRGRDPISAAPFRGGAALGVGADADGRVFRLRIGLGPT